MKYGLIGEKLGHSYSRIIHNLLGNQDYTLCEVPPAELQVFLTDKEFLGVNVTIPYKQAVIPSCIASNEALRIGSVNTIVNKNGILYGYNTDYMGFAYMAERKGIGFHNKKALILGSGGTSKTAACVATDNNAREIIVVSRNGENNYENLSKHFDSDIIINTTPVGMYPNNDGCAVDISSFYRLSAVMDVVYNPLNTNLILAAKKRGIIAASGLSMLVTQAVYAHNLFFNTDNSVNIEAIITQVKQIFNNIILIGMPGSGKSTIGRLLAEKTGRKFIDTDEEISKITGKTPRQIITEYGEERFRKIESQVVADAAKTAGKVIATGGGSVLSEHNRNCLLQNGYVVYLQRDLSQLSIENRPLSVNLEQLYEARRIIYESMCHARVTVSGTAEETLEKIIL